jgi:hypothetical protein
MTRYLVCKHQVFRDPYGWGIYSAFTIYGHIFEHKENAKAVAAIKNRTAKKYFYKVKRIEV